MSRRVLLATRSAGKLRELKGIVEAAGLTAVSLVDECIPESVAEEEIECHATFEENALAKARYFNRLSGLAALADDSGLCVRALGGAPGVWSKRFSGRHDLRGQALDDANNAKLLVDLRDRDDLTASYVCAAAYADESVELVELGETAGRIVIVPSGANGFGYDPHFYSDELGRTFGNAGTQEKEDVSHRGRAFRMLFAALRGRESGV